MGLTPSESSPGESSSQGPITKAGNRHARRLLVESGLAPQQAIPALGSPDNRWKQASPAARSRGHLGNQRLRHRWMMFNQRKKKSTIASVAVARELAGCSWSLATLE